MESEYLTSEQIEVALSDVLASPKERGRLEAIVIRPEPNEREFRTAVHLSPEAGVEGDRWLTSSGLLLPDGQPDRRAQVSLMNARLLKLIAGSHERMRLAGDNLIVDFGLGEENIPVGQKLAVGEVLLQVTDLPHTGCRKFSERFGPDALRFINAAERRSLRLRGLYAQVLKAGTIRIGDAIQKVE